MKLDKQTNQNPICFHFNPFLILLSEKIRNQWGIYLQIFRLSKVSAFSLVYIIFIAIEIVFQLIYATFISITINESFVEVLLAIV